MSLNNHVPLETISKMLGHSDITTTQIYARMMDNTQTALPAIRDGKTSEVSLKTATHICARIAANIAVGRKVKHFPRFYLCKNLD